jgi:hypothetical protein
LLKRCNKSTYAVRHYGSALKTVKGNLANLRVFDHARICGSHPVASALVPVPLAPSHDFSAIIISAWQIVYGTVYPFIHYDRQAFMGFNQYGDIFQARRPDPLLRRGNASRVD